MSGRLAQLFGDKPATLRPRAAALLLVVLSFNAAAWIWAAMLFQGNTILLGTALLAYGLGLRHAVDADHIAAIDNVTRKLMQENRQPVAVGLFFSLGHSTIVVLASAAIAATAMAFKDRFEALHAVGGFVGTLVSAVFLLAIAAMNFVILVSVIRTFVRVKAGGPYNEDDLDVLLAGRGLLARLFRPLFRMIRRSWHMYLLGFLFGLGFDTATEVGVLGISAAQGTNGLAMWSIMVFPALFAAGMSLIDTADGVMMVGAYGWAFMRPLRKLYYNIAITLASALVALLIGGIEALGLIGQKLQLKGSFWDGIGAISANFGTLGYLIVAAMAGAWILSAVVYRLAGSRTLEGRT